jgi:hypothetical protein
MVQGEQALEEFSIDRRHRPAVTVVGISVRRISWLAWSVIPPLRSTSSITFSADVKCILRPQAEPDASDLPTLEEHLTIENRNGCILRIEAGAARWAKPTGGISVDEAR